jgi:hypothetical protein
MSIEPPARQSKNVAVMLLGAATLLVGGAYAGFGAFLVLAGTGWLVQPNSEPWLPALFLGRSIAIVIGIAFLPLGTLGLLAGLGVLLRKEWGRTLTLFFAAVAFLLGLVWVSGAENVVQDATDVWVGAAQLLYGILAFLFLILRQMLWTSRRLV